MNLRHTLDEMRDAAPGPRKIRAWAREHKKASLGVGLLVLWGALAWGADFLSPNDYRAQARSAPSAPPSVWRWREAGGDWRARPFIYPIRLSDPLARTYAEDTARPHKIEFMARGYPYKFLGFIPAERHLLGVRGGADAPRLHLLGTDALGRDRWARLLRAARFSLLVGPLGALAASALGVFLGMLAAYRRGWAESLLMRAADTMMSLPAMVLILAARAAFPLELPPLRAGLMMVLIFAAVGWADMARLARGLALEMLQKEFTLAARSVGLTETRILWRHVLPNLARPLAIQFMLLLPSFLLAETALSFFGVGLQEPEPSWGNMLAEAASVTALNAAPFLLLTPALAIFTFVLGLRLAIGSVSLTQKQSN
jgi:peptide/nickel transport system permease protein